MLTIPQGPASPSRRRDHRRRIAMRALSRGNRTIAAVTCVFLAVAVVIGTMIVSPTTQGGAASPAVAVAGLSPTSGTGGGGTSVSINGSGFTGATSVYFGLNVSSAFTVNSDTSITATAPIGSGVVVVTVTTASGTSLPAPGADFTYTGTPVPVGVSGQTLTLDGLPTLFTGVDAFELGTYWGTNAGCGTMLSDSQLNAFFASLRPNSLVRFSALQATIVTNYFTHAIDWAPLDRVFETAAANHQYLIPILAGQGAPCDGAHWQDPSWYQGGYRNVFNSATNSDGRGLTPLSYWDFMQAVVNRYKASPALAMWEPISEPEASTCPVADQPTNCAGHQTCPDEATAAQALRSFFDTVGGEIHALDPNHPVESGLLGSGQCGTGGADYTYVSASPAIDVGSVHDYYGGDQLLGGDQWNGIALRIQQMASLHKPIIDGEVGVEAANGGAGCDSPAQRVVQAGAKDAAQFAAGVAGTLVWNWSPDVMTNCDYTVTAGDPLMSLLGSVNQYTTGAAPVVSGVNPGSNGAGSGQVVTVTGSGFTGATAVSFGAQPASSFFADGDTTLSVVVPSGVTGNAHVTVTTPGGKG